MEIKNQTTKNPLFLTKIVSDPRSLFLLFSLCIIYAVFSLLICQKKPNDLFRIDSQLSGKYSEYQGGGRTAPSLSFYLEKSIYLKYSGSSPQYERLKKELATTKNATFWTTKRDGGEIYQVSIDGEVIISYNETFSEKKAEKIQSIIFFFVLCFLYAPIVLITNQKK